MSVKAMLQERLHRRQLARYEAELARQRAGYRRRLEDGARRIEDGTDCREGECRILSVEQLASVAEAARERGGRELLWIIAKAPGYLAAGAAERIQSYLAKERDCLWLYTDEDICTPEGELVLPYYKPDYSPETLRSYDYTGGLLAVRAEALRDWTGEGGRYGLALWLAEHSPAGHIREILYHAREEGYHEEGRMYVRREEGSYRYPLYPIPAGVRLSVLIPSKDHPEVLERCVRSLRERSSYERALTEIVVVDNGSAPERRQAYEALAEAYDLRYLYRPMEFNFSRMCNLAAAEASGEYLLFLNDDTELTTADGLERLLGQAMQPGIGAVGAKLYYPGGDLIQHAGITNMYEGPVHKLFGWSDSCVYDRGRNRGVRNVLGVTAACLMISRAAYDAAGGLSEELAVAYNDVDFCFSLIERGYRNILRNDVILTHYESLSRGDDNRDDTKKQRLARERATLYRRHPDFYDYDPYYHPQLTGASERYEAAAPLENKNLPVITRLTAVRKRLSEEAINETLILRQDHLEPCYYAADGRRRAYLIDLHAHIRGLDSCDYRYQMYLRSAAGTVYRVPAVRRYRPDVETTYYEQTHVELSGYAVKLSEEALPAGSYEVWMEAASAISRQRLYNRLEARLEVAEASLMDRKEVSGIG